MLYRALGDALHAFRDVFIAFKTDVDISQKSQTMKHRELQAWKPSADVPEPSVNFQAGNGDDRTFGVGSNGGWDQFAVNEQLYGVKTQFDEELYTTKLDRTAADFKERERKAQRIANEILGVRAFDILTSCLILMSYCSHRVLPVTHTSRRREIKLLMIVVLTRKIST